MSNFDPKKSTDWFIFTRFFSTHLGTHFWKSLKVDSGDPPCKDVITRWTMVPLNTLSDQVCIRYPFGFVYLNCLFSFAVSLQKWLAHFLLVNMEKLPFYSGRRLYLPYFCWDTGFKGFWEPIVNLCIKGHFNLRQSL